MDKFRTKLRMDKLRSILSFNFRNWTFQKCINSFHTIIAIFESKLSKKMEKISCISKQIRNSKKLVIRWLLNEWTPVVGGNNRCGKVESEGKANGNGMATDGYGDGYGYGDYGDNWQKTYFPTEKSPFLL